MTLDLSDIQGNILRGYRLPFARYVFVNLAETEPARALMGRVFMHITNAENWSEKPSSTLNMALSRTALRALKVPEATIDGMPDEFLEGMAARAQILGDVGRSAPENWDEVWKGRVDVMFSINAMTPEAREERFAWLEKEIRDSGGGEIIGQQEAGVLHSGGEFKKTEHFGYSDGIGQPGFYQRSYSQPGFKETLGENIPGDGKIDKSGNWEQLATGEFILGYANESKELPKYPDPPIFARNGSFMVYRKLRQNVAAFRAYFDEWGEKYPGGKEKLRAKFIGRWTDGTPLMLSPDRPDPEIANDKNRVNNFSYADDPHGLKCPLGAHLRRMNPRDSMGFAANLTRIRRIIRRGLPYGTWAEEGQPVDDSDRGIIFMALNSSIMRQYEFVQQQWVNYGNDFRLGEERDPMIGAHDGTGVFTIPGDTSKGEEPFFCKGIPSFVETAGGDYFFIPSITTIRMMSEGRVDPR